MDLCVTGTEKIRAFVAKVTALAINDHEERRKKPRTGRELCNLYAGDGHRKGHFLFAARLYSGVRWSLEQADREAAGDFPF